MLIHEMWFIAYLMLYYVDLSDANYTQKLLVLF